MGIESFLLDCHTNDNISEIEGEFGVKGFAVVVRLWQKIYSEKGYYCEWVDRSPLLFLSKWFGGNSGVTVSLINEIVDRCLSNGIFDAGMYGKYSVLTSARIQEQYFDVVKRREHKLAWLYRHCVGDSFAERAGVLFLNFQLAFDNPVPSFYAYDLAVGAIGAAAVKGMVYLKGKNAKKYRQGAEYGSARWGGWEGYRAIHRPGV